MRAIVGEWPRAGRGGCACAWLLQLPLRVEVLRNPRRDGAPLVLAANPGERKVVRLCSPEAEAAGVRPGLPLREVLTLCPDAVVVQPDPVRLAAALDRVAIALERVGPAVEVQGELVYLDLRGLRALYRGELAALERAIRDAIPAALRPRVGIAENKFVAAVAAREAPPAGSRVVAPHRSADFLRPLPIGYLPLDPDALERLGRFGLRAIGDLAALPLGAVQAQFGAAGARAWRLAHGQDDEPVLPRRYTPAVAVALRVDDPLASQDAIFAALDQLLARAFADPLLRARSARQARLRALLADGSSWERLVTFKEPLSERESARRALRARLELPGGMPAAPVDELHLELIGLGAEAARQGGLFAEPAVQLGRVGDAARQLRARYGHSPIYRAVEVEPWSRIPERRWALEICEL